MPRRHHDRSTTRRSSRLLWKHDYDQFRKRLAEARHDAELTQVQVAKALGRPNSYVAKCENGERRVDAVELAKFASLYRKPIKFFFPFLHDPR